MKWFLVALIACTIMNTSVGENKMEKTDISKHWSTPLKVEDLDRLPQNQRDSRLGYIEDEDSWLNIWKVWRPDEKLPEVDFGTHFVVIAKNVRYVNRIRFVSAELTEGVLNIELQKTRTARPIRDKVHCVMLVVPRQNVERLGNESISIPVL